MCNEFPLRCKLHMKIHQLKKIHTIQFKQRNTFIETIQRKVDSDHKTSSFISKATQQD